MNREPLFGPGALRWLLNSLAVGTAVALLLGSVAFLFASAAHAESVGAEALRVSIVAAALKHRRMTVRMRLVAVDMTPARDCGSSSAPDRSTSAHD